MSLPTPRHAHRVAWRSSAPFLAVHLTPLLAVFTGVTAEAVVLGLVLYWLRMFAITAGYHRYFAHRAFRLARIPQLAVAFVGAAAAQKGPLWWASNHRQHHRASDTEGDPHSPQKGFWWSHIGWVLSGEYGTGEHSGIEDFARFPELRFLDRHDWIAPWSFAIASFLIAGWSGLVVGFFTSTVLLWHTTFSVNSVAHIWGWRRFATPDSSRNNPLVAVLTMGEGWHNNHHHHPACARQGFAWYEIDVTYYLLKMGSWLGLVRDLRTPAPSVLAARRRRDLSVDIGRLRQHLSRAAATVSDDESERDLLDAIASLETTVRRRRATDGTSRQVVRQVLVE